MIMKKRSLARRIALAGVACALCASVGVGSAFAYYTDTTNAQGSLPYSVDPKTTIDEGKDEDELSKHISIKNTTNVPCLVRVKLFYAEQNVSVTVTGDQWAQLDPDDGWLYYAEPLMGMDAATTDLYAQVTVNEETANTTFDVTVVQECVPIYQLDGSYTGDFPSADGKVPVKVSDMKVLPKDGVALKGFTMKVDNGTEAN